MRAERGWEGEGGGRWVGERRGKAAVEGHCGCDEGRRSWGGTLKWKHNAKEEARRQRQSASGWVSQSS